MMVLPFIYSSEADSVISVFILFLFACLTCYLVFRNARDIWEHGRNLEGNNGYGTHSQIPKMRMTKVHIPFTFKIQDPQLGDGEISCLVSSQETYKFMAFWAVTAHELHMLLWMPWTAMSESIADGSFLDGHYVMKGPVMRNECHDEKVFKLPCPVENYVDLITNPTLCYPLVIFLVTDSEEIPEPEEAVALISILHVSDCINVPPTSIMSQYLKQANGQVSRLQQLFLANDDPEDNLNLVERENSTQLCVVCLNLPLSRALLPCRHTCVCGSCFNRLTCCPLCRSPIRSYFCIRNEDYLNDLSRNSAQNKTIFERVQEFIYQLLDGEEWLP